MHGGVDGGGQLFGPGGGIEDARDAEILEGARPVARPVVGGDNDLRAARVEGGVGGGGTAIMDDDGGESKKVVQRHGTEAEDFGAQGRAGEIRMRT